MRFVIFQPRQADGSPSHPAVRSRWHILLHASQREDKDNLFIYTACAPNAGWGNYIPHYHEIDGANFEPPSLSMDEYCEACFQSSMINRLLKARIKRYIDETSAYQIHP